MRNIPYLSNLNPRLSSRFDVDFRRRLSQLSFYQYGKLGFWAAIGVILTATIGITLGELGIYIDSLSILVQNPSNGFF